MSFGQNLQFLRKMHKGMTQEELAEIMKVSRQTVSKWEVDGAYPELEKIIELCRLFNCSMDQLVRGDLNVSGDAYSDICVIEVKEFRYIRYAVISGEPEEDAKNHVRLWAESFGVENPDIIGWDFPVLSQEQINVYHMHGYAAAWIIPEGFPDKIQGEIITQPKHRYARITITSPFDAPFTLIPNAYKTLMSYIEVNGLGHCEDKGIIPCFEREYEKDSVSYMDVFIAVE